MNAKTLEAAVEFGLSVLAGATGTYRGLAAVSERRTRGGNAVRVSTETSSVEVFVRRGGAGGIDATVSVPRFTLGVAGSVPVCADCSLLSPGEAGFALEALRKLAWGFRAITVAGPFGRFGVVSGGETAWRAK